MHVDLPVSPVGVDDGRGTRRPAAYHTAESVWLGVGLLGVGGWAAMLVGQPRERAETSR